MSRIDIGEIQTFAYQLHTANETARKSIKDIKNAVENYIEDGSLKGKAVDASKNYYQMTYFPLCDAIIEAMNESEERLAQYIADFHAQVDGSADARIDADGLYELGKMIDRIEAKKEALAQRMNTGTEGQMQSYRSQLSIAYKQENILEKYLAFEQSHGGFFDNLTDLVQGIQQTIRELQSNIQFNSKTGTYDMSKLNFTTVTRMQNALGKALNDNAKTFNFDEYQKTYRGQMWVLMKNGIVDVEATNAYNSAVLGGEMPHESNEAQEEAELLQAVIQSVKEGTDPVTGQEISKAQGFSIISGLFFRYTTGGYKGKKFKIPKDWLRRRKKASGAKGFNIDEIHPKLKTEPDTAFFWSGRTEGVGGADIAADVAKSKGGVTLESTIGNKNIEMPDWDFNNPESMKAWDLASGSYAEQVSGEVRAVVGSDLRKGNIWENVELPRLKNNPNVTKITTIDPKTGLEKIIFERK
ncbi:T7SS effector LXG polymorphic toxin [Listeria monocytogenes]|uniref:T7SS effector LXG polymorphic toxin n=1 Tax=Listeria monocytogenes TaxID=1639 RepID=UPI000A200CA5|nr:T7SS effector LXG polymorphic toxin [Listeria monocytogenes]EAC4535247.1 transposase [Listeria monocytogenes]EAW7070266.1 transposase [Listeria monocytogenes]EAW7303159.1 transposase [Listeria monocytogenes]EBH4233434.1 transposase [Listeria monocytogenes]ECC0391832.1 transposase [Listeria monocytogenes]